MSNFCILGLKFPSNFPRICLIARFHEKNESTKISVLLDRNLKMTLVEISTLKFVLLQNFAKGQKYLNLGPKMTYLGIFGQRFLKNYCDI